MERFTLDTAIGLNMTHAFFYAMSVNAAVWNRARLVEAKLRGCLRDTGATFAQTQVHSGSLSWLYIIFVHMIHNVTPAVVPGREFHTGTKFRNGIM